MAAVQRRAIYHIVHVENLPSIIETGGLLSDRLVVERKLRPTGIGMSDIKERRLTLAVSCHPGTCVGDYVPFYFCPRSVMLFVIHKQNHPALAYRGGQLPIVHLVFDLFETVAWAEGRTPQPREWALSLSNAGSRYAQFRTGLDKLDDIDWEAVGAADFRSPDVRESKQAECLIGRAVPWHLVRAIGVSGLRIRPQVEAALEGASHKPAILIRPDWYF